MKNNSAIKIILVIACLTIGVLLNSGCGIYSFTGASVSADVATFSVSTFEDNLLTNPNLSQLLTDELINELTANTNLSPVRLDGDLKFEGKITRYQITPVTTTTASSAAQSRLTIEVAVKFVNETETDKNFEQRFSDFEDFDQSINFSTVEASLVSEINERIINKIFNKALVNW